MLSIGIDIGCLKVKFYLELMIVYRIDYQRSLSIFHYVFDLRSVNVLTLVVLTKWCVNNIVSQFALCSSWFSISAQFSYSLTWMAKANKAYWGWQLLNQGKYSCVLPWLGKESAWDLGCWLEPQSHQHLILKQNWLHHLVLIIKNHQQWYPRNLLGNPAPLAQVKAEVAGQAAS